ncbi:MAG: aminotransferase class IV [Clostridia bacterium]
MKEVGYYNGTFGPLEEMRIPMLDRACYFGDGVYDFSLAYNGKIFALEEHVDRLYRSASMIEIEIPYTKEEMKAILREAAEKSECEKVSVYWQVSRGTAIRNHVFPETNVKANLMIMVKPGSTPGEDAAYKLITLEDTRYLHCNIKTINLLPSVIAAEKARKAGCDEAVFHRGSRVTECAHCNIHILQNGVFRTAPADCYILPGIARRHLIDMCGKLGIPVAETPFTLEELMAADEVMVSSSSTLCIQAVEIDGKPVGGKDPLLLGKIRSAVYKEFNDFMNG